jgi:hypothetical protein
MRPYLRNKIQMRGLVVDCFPDMREALGLVPSTEKEEWRKEMRCTQCQASPPPSSNFYLNMGWYKTS